MTSVYTKLKDKSSERLSARFRCLRFLEVADRRVELVSASCVTEPDDVPIILSQRVSLYRIPRPRTGLVYTVSDVKVVHLVFSVNYWFSVGQVSVPPCAFYVCIRFKTMQECECLNRQIYYMK